MAFKRNRLRPSIGFPGFDIIIKRPVYAVQNCDQTNKISRETQMSTALLKFAISLALAGLLSACGGGGGGGGSGGGGTDPSTLLAFNTTNAGRVAGYPLWASELMLRIGQAVVEEAAAAAKHSAATAVTVNCSSGTLQRSWTDKDGNGSLSARDEISLDFSACARDPLARSAQGRITVVLESVTNGGDFVARVVLPAPGMVLAAVVGTPGPQDFRVSGQTRVEMSRNKLRHTLLIGGGSDDAIAFDFPGAPFAADRITAFRFEKTSRWDEARIQLDIRMRYDCPELGGSFDVSMPTPIRSWLDELPEPSPQQGSFVMRGRGGDLVSLTIGSASRGPSDLSVALDLAGDGSVEAHGTGTWEGIGLVSGVFFADYTHGGRGNTFAYNANEFTLRLPFVGGSELPVDTTFSLQFTRPVAGASAWRWRLMDLGRLDQMPTAGIEVPVQAELQGALITLKPALPLRYSRRYELLVDTGESIAGAQVMRATTGGTLSRYAGNVGLFTTPNILNPQSSLAGHLTLMAGATVEAVGLPPPPGAPAGIRFHWTQLGGTPLTIDRPNERSTFIGLAPGASGVGSAKVRLTVSLDGAGNSESADFVLRTVADTSGAWVSRLRVPIDLTDWFSLPKELWSGPAVGTLLASQQGDRLSLTYAEAADPAHPNGNWSLVLISADGQALRPGIYANAYSSSWFQRPAVVPTLDLVSGQMQLSSVQGEFVIYELEVDGEGRITKLALDFTAPQGSGPVTASGAVRINSARALPQ
ncbi:MAG: hypothetical protein ACKVQR_22695 [Aquabacterium sp.]